MSSRDVILGRLQTPDGTGQTISLPEFDSAYLGDPLTRFKELIVALHGEINEVNNTAGVLEFINRHYPGQRVLLQTSFPSLNNLSDWQESDPHDLQNVEFALFEGRLGVAENGAVWFDERLMGQRVAPYITQQMGILLKKETIVPTLAQAYKELGRADSGFGGFIAGPSKTADIEQSLVTGAHGARGLVVFLM